MDNIELKDIPNFEGIYAITKDGKVWSYKTNTFLSQSKNSSGYFQVHLITNEDKLYLVHRLVAMTYLDNPENKPTVDHINRIRSDNRVENLRWATHKEQYENQDNSYFKEHQLEIAGLGGSKLSKGVEMRDKDNHSILYKTFPSSYQAAIQEFGDKNKNSLINRCANGKKPSAYGYWWCFVK